MPTLNWIGRKAIEKYHLQVAFRLLRRDESLSVGNANTRNLLIHSDNLPALKSLLPFHARGIRCIYIDPPYNTGKENWIYNDNVNSPEIREWLNHVVGKEGEDLSRHDKWLCMMYPRLALAKMLLSDDGVIFISIDDSELPSLRLLMDELFRPQKNARLFRVANRRKLR